MGLFSTAVQQREKEDEALKSFSVFSLTGLGELHVAALSLGNFWIGETKLAEEPIEVTVLDSPKVEAAPTPETLVTPSPLRELSTVPFELSNHSSVPPE